MPSKGYRGISLDFSLFTFDAIYFKSVVVTIENNLRHLYPLDQSIRFDNDSP